MNLFFSRGKMTIKILKKFTLFLLFTIFWVIMAGFGLPIGLLAGFIFGKWYGVLILVIGMSIGASILYMIGKYFF